MHRVAKRHARLSPMAEGKPCESVAQGVVVSPTMPVAHGVVVSPVTLVPYSAGPPQWAAPTCKYMTHRDAEAYCDSLSEADMDPRKITGCYVTRWRNGTPLGATCFWGCDNSCCSGCFLVPCCCFLGVPMINPCLGVECDTGAKAHADWRCCDRGARGANWGNGFLAEIRSQNGRQSGGGSRVTRTWYFVIDKERGTIARFAGSATTDRNPLTPSDNPNEQLGWYYTKCKYGVCRDDRNATFLRANRDEFEHLQTARKFGWDVDRARFCGVRPRDGPVRDTYLATLPPRALSVDVRAKSNSFNSACNVVFVVNTEQR